MSKTFSCLYAIMTQNNLELIFGFQHEIPVLILYSEVSRIISK